MSATADAECLKLVKDRSDTVWFCNGGESPICAQVPYATFVRTPILRRASAVRVVGSADYADIILDLWKRRVLGNLKVVQLCSPTVVERKTLLDDPQTALYALRAYGNVPSLGGWRDVEPADLASFRLRSSPGFRRELLAAHPVYKAATFVAGLDETALYDLIAAIIDPRWHVDPVDPDALSPLLNFLGITHSNYLQAQQHRLPRNETERLGWRVRDAWICGRGLDPQAPGAFVVRAGLCMKKQAERELFSSLTFVSFLRAVWLNCLDGTHKGRLFCPEHYFADTLTQEAYRQHMGLRLPDRVSPESA